MVTGVENLLALALALTSMTGLYTIYTADEKYQAVLGASRFFILLFVSLAVAGPQINMSQERMQNAEITVLQDNSHSTQFMNYDGLNLEDVEVNREVIASGNNSDIKAGLERNLEENSAYLVVSDLQTDEDLGPTIEKYQQQNSSISFLKPEMETEHSVHIQGPDKTVPGAENRYNVKVHSTEDSAVPATVTLDGETIYEGEIGDNYTFTRQFESKGRYKLKASIDVEDQKEKNNQYFKTVEVTEKPDILVVGDQSGLETDIQQYFDLEVESNLPDDLSTYDSILLKKEVSEEQLLPYISEGNGLVYTGDYNNDYDVLPVKKVPGTDNGNEGVRVVLAVDTSYSLFSDYDQTARNVSKDFVAYLGENNPSSEVSVINYGLGPRGSFNPRIMRNSGEPAFLPLTYSDDRQQLMDRIASLNQVPAAIQSRGLKGAKELAERSDERTAVVMITDGRFEDVEYEDNTVITGGQDRQNIQQTANSMDQSQNPLYFVTIGDQSEGRFLRRLTSNQNVRSFEYLQGGGEFDIMAGGDNSGVATLQTVNNQHFITRGGVSDSRAVGQDSVTVRSGGNLLLSTQKGEPVLTTWRYGLGRVAAFSADNENLAGLMRNSPSTVIRSLSWTVGEKDREGEWISISSARKGESRPEVEASYSIEDLSRTADGTYSTELDTGSTGFHTFEQVPYSVNYNSELQEIGYSDRIESAAEETGGNVYRPDEKSEMVDDLQSFSSEKVVEKTSLSTYFLVAALIVFLAEVAFRKFKGRK